jgi:hypothetical protein
MKSDYSGGRLAAREIGDCRLPIARDEAAGMNRGASGASASPHHRPPRPRRSKIRNPESKMKRFSLPFQLKYLSLRKPLDNPSALSNDHAAVYR